MIRSSRQAADFLGLLVLSAVLVGCKEAEPGAVAADSVRATGQRTRAPAPPLDRKEYTDMPAAGSQTHPVVTELDFAAEAQRGGPHGEARIFESPQELAELSRGARAKSMNGQFRYYLVSVAMVQPEGECKTPLLAVNVAVENLHGTPTTSIYGKFMFSQTLGGEGSTRTEAVATPYYADILGPFSNKQGGLVYATAYLQPADPRRDSERWAQIAGINAQRLKVWFKPEAFYYADATQYSEQTGKVKSQRDVLTCGGSEGARSVIR